MSADIETLSAEPVNSADQRSPLFAGRKKIFPKRASGQFRRLKWLIMAVTLGIYYITPWLRWDRGPYAPDQAVLIDLAHRRFYFFFIEIWPQEFFFVAGMLVMAGLGLFLVTSVVGRAWCGYTCPQTVWVDLFLVVERYIEGDRNARMALDKAPYGWGKISKRVIKHGIWLLIGVATGGAWIFYFADAPSLAVDFARLQAPMIAYATVGVLTFTTYVFGGLMREQVCTYMCPWPRIQGAMLDEHSLTVTYNDWRGEPRGKHQKKVEATKTAPKGDCVDCNACVAVCPMGIDIRKGQQIECITCALCIDACDGVMDKLGRERGLIGYATLADYAANMALATNVAGAIDPSLVHDEGGRIKTAFKHFDWQIILRPRTLIYSAIWAAIGVGLLVVFASRDRIDASLLHDRNPQYVRLSDGGIQNGYQIKLSNMRAEPRLFSISLDGIDAATLVSAGIDVVNQRSLVLGIEPDRVRNLRITVRLPPEAVTAEHMPFLLTVRDVVDGETVQVPGIFESPAAAAVQNRSPLP